ncbi:hypothetical protein SAMN05216207_101558 [Pseudonocardia ammonioxydans]|uniref:STAS domain-containing protein n=1 Tax=Pseudonocardia ammonioxydans TaxID=260086 RepID=A0A1I4ZGW8_PSUAM|nr:STAS domain-containing protein [Pseudonocardia ammonioxydans]SFN49150.1 hypothetical protein SAMN05216207_101558 [Pseudonocardia ammonioxydans]
MVERRQGDIVVIRVSGVCTRATAASLLRLTDLHADLATADPPHRRELVAVLVDLEDTTGLAEDALRDLRGARSRARRTGFAFALTGARAQVHRLPLPVQELLAEFSTYPTVDAALVALGSAAPSPNRASA